MRTNTNIKSTALFFLEGKSYSGILEVRQGSQILGKILTNNSLDKDDLTTGYFLNVVHVIIRENNILGTLFNCEIYNSCTSSYGLYEYTIVSNYLITGDRFDNEEEIKITKLSFINNDYSALIGNSLVKTVINTKENRAAIKIENETKSSINEFTNYRAYQESFHKRHNINRNEFKVHQTNALVYEFKTKLGIYDIRRFILQIELFFTLLFQHPSLNEEIIFFVTDDTGRESFRHIYFTRKKFNECKANLNQDIFPSSELISNIFRYIENWLLFVNKIPFIENYIVSYFTTNFIDQKVQGQLYLLNSIHPFFFGKTQVNKYSGLIEKVRQSSLDQVDKDEIMQMLAIRNGYGFRKMLIDLFDRYKQRITKEDINTLNSFRSSQAHGGSFSLEITEYIRFNKMLFNLLLRIVREVIEK